MSRENGDKGLHNKKVDLKKLKLETQHQRRVVIAKSRYKIYDPPTRSNFSVCLDNIKRERQSFAPKEQYESKAQTETHHRPGPRAETMLVRDDSFTRLSRKRMLNFRDAYSEYLSRPKATPRRIRIVKIYAPQKWEEALEESIKKFVPVYRLRNSWQQPRLHWLEQLERHNEMIPDKSQSDEAVSSKLCCFFFLYPLWTQKRKL